MQLIIVCVIFAAICLATPATAQPILPAGSAPKALEFAHFPDRMHAFIWRNWNLVASDRLARVLNTPAANVRAVAGAMGLPAEQAIPASYPSRLYLTIIRRNWHLLPYEQILTLLDWTPQRLAETLREDDFLFIKLGSLKPRCEALTYTAPGEEQRRREEEIRRIVAEEFGAAMARPAEARLAFLQGLSGAVETPRPAQASTSVRFLYSYFAVFGDPLADPTLDPYPDALLQKYADLGVNGVWLHVVLRQLALPMTFPSLATALRFAWRTCASWWRGRSGLGLACTFT